MRRNIHDLFSLGVTRKILCSFLSREQNNIVGRILMKIFIILPEKHFYIAFGYTLQRFSDLPR